MVPAKRKKPRKEERNMDAEKPKISIKYNVDVPLDEFRRTEKVIETPQSKTLPKAADIKSEPISLKELHQEKSQSDGMKRKEPAKDAEKKEEPAKDPFLEDEKKTSKIFLWLSIIIIIALIVLIINLDKLVPPKQGTNQTYVAEVNGEGITQEYLDRMYKASVPAQFQQVITKDVFLQKSLVPQMVLLQEAKKYDFTVRDEEIKQVVDELITNAGMDEERFKQKLSEDGLSLEDIYSIYRTNIIVNKLLNATLLKNVEVTMPERVRASQILVETEKEAQSIKKELENGADFGTLALEKSKDPSAKQNKGDLGYFEKGAMVPEFEAAAFSLAPGKISAPVKTSFGYHIIKVVDKKQKRTVLYSDITDLKERQFAYEQNKAAVQTYIDALVSRADINIMNTTETKPVTGPEKPILTKMSLGECLAEKGAILYTAKNCPECEEQRDLIGEGKEKIQNVACWDGSSASQLTECDDAGIEGYPTWIINGKQLKGLQTVAQLQKETGCVA